MFNTLYFVLILGFTFLDGALSALLVKELLTEEVNVTRSIDESEDVI